jgi:hypothetical protein
VNPAFGTEADLAELSAALHARGMVSADCIAVRHGRDELLMLDSASISWLISSPITWHTWAAVHVLTTADSTLFRRYAFAFLCPGFSKKAESLPVAF